MPNRPGFFQLQSPLDLLNKMQADYTRRLSTDPFDAYAAFDFFVAAHHLPEWLSKAKCRASTSDKYGCALRAICKQLAKGAKHFTVKDDDDAVSRTTVHPPARSGLMRAGASRAGDLTGHLMIHLGQQEASALSHRDLDHGVRRHGAHILETDSRARRDS